MSVEKFRQAKDRMREAMLEYLAVGGTYDQIVKLAKDGKAEKLRQAKDRLQVAMLEVLKAGGTYEEILRLAKDGEAVSPPMVKLRDAMDEFVYLQGDPDEVLELAEIARKSHKELKH